MKISCHHKWKNHKMFAKNFLKIGFSPSQKIIGTMRLLLKTTFFLPQIREKRQQLSLNPVYTSLVIFDHFRGQCTDKYLSLLKDIGIYILIMLANCTDRLQPLYVRVS